MQIADLMVIALYLYHPLSTHQGDGTDEYGLDVENRNAKPPQWGEATLPYGRGARSEKTYTTFDLDTHTNDEVHQFFSTGASLEMQMVNSLSNLWYMV